MRFHIRRLVLLALSATCVAVVVLNVLRPYDDVDITVPQVVVEQRPPRPISLNERLAKYGPGAGRTTGNFTAPDTPNLRPDLALITPRLRPNLQLSTQPESIRKDEAEETDVGLMSESVSGSHNERIRRRYVQLPDESGSAVRSLWWSSSDTNPDDRILAQMRHVPLNYQRDETKLKTIYMPGGLGNEPEGREKFIVEQCPVDNCRLTSHHSVALTAELRLLQSDAFFHYAKKPPGQIWAIFLLESPANTGEFAQAKDLINWTATYRWDSTLVTPYEKFTLYPNASRLPDRRSKRLRASTSNATELNTTTRKTKMVAWFVSNCGPKNRRNEYAKELAKYVCHNIIISAYSV